MKDTNGLLVFAAVAKHLNFRQAAIELDIPLATVSRRISELEQDIGVQLLQRTTRRVSLTRAGMQLLEDIRQPLALLQEASQRLLEEQQEPTGLVRIASTTNMATTNVLPILSELQQRYPAIRIELILGPDVVDLRFEKIDLAIRGGIIEDQSLIARRLATHTFACYTTQQWIEQSDIPMLSYDEDLQFESTPWLKVEDLHLLQQMVLQGLGQAWLLTDLCQIEEANSRLIRRTDLPEKSFDVYLVYPSRHYLPRKVCVVRDLLLEYAGNKT